VSRKLADQKAKAQCETGLKGLLRKYSDAEYELYLAENDLLLGPLEKSYNVLRRNPAWYLRKDLIDDCVKRGGCYARQCGCCRRRHNETERVKGAGHCTPSCGCCSYDRGFEYTERQKEDRFDIFVTKMNDQNPAHITYMARA
jgi:hypothetical protein